MSSSGKPLSELQEQLHACFSSLQTCINALDEQVAVAPHSHGNLSLFLLLQSTVYVFAAGLGTGLQVGGSAQVRQSNIGSQQGIELSSAAFCYR